MLKYLEVVVHTVAILRLLEPATTEISGTASKIGALSFTSLRFTVIVKGLEDFGLSSTNSRTKTWKLNRFSFGGSRSRLA